MIQRLILTALITALLVMPAAYAQIQPLPQFSHPTDFFLEVAKGNVRGHVLFAKFGENPEIAAVSGFEDIWDAGGTYATPTAPSLHNVVSSLAADAGTVVSSGTATGGDRNTLIDGLATFVSDGVAVGDLILNDTDMLFGVVSEVTSETRLATISGMTSPNSGISSPSAFFGASYRVVTDASTGASVLHIVGLDATRQRIEEFVVMNGVTIVPTTKAYSRQYRGRVFATASTDAAGTITSTAQSGGTVTMQIIDGNNQTLMAIYTCPVPKICYITKWWGTISKTTGGGAVAILHLRGGTLDNAVTQGIGYILQTRSIDNDGSSTFTYNYSVPVAIPGGSDLWVEADTTATVGVSSGFDVIEIHPDE